MEQNQPINGGILNLAKVTEQLLRNDSDNCDITYTHGDMEIVFNFCIMKITHKGEVVYDAEDNA